MAPTHAERGAQDPGDGPHPQDRTTDSRRLHEEGEHLRALLELTNAVTTRDVTSLVAAIAPNLQRIVGHDDLSVFLLPPASEQMGAYALTAHGVGWTDELTAQLRPDMEPFATWLAERRTVDIDLDHFEWTGREGIRANTTAAGLKRACFVPLATHRENLGFLVLNRRAAVPFTPDELQRSSQGAAQIAMALENALAFREIAALKDRLARENIYLEEEIRGAQHFGEIVGESRVLKRILGQVSTVAATDATVLLLGETGTGKELIARAIHAASERSRRSLVTVNCATSPAGLLESEWFGHERGAFTGALSQKIGRFELAHQGTLFLD
jgi:formate hydrogenlyase transcriptional activator